MSWVAVVLAALLALGSALWLRTRRYRNADDEVQRTLSPWWLPPTAALATLLATTCFSGVRVSMGTTYVVALVWALTLAFIDLEVRRLPDALTLPAYPVAAVLLAWCSLAAGGWPALLRAAAASGIAVTGFLLLLLVLLLLSPAGGLGLGDVKLSGVLGGLLAWLSWTTALSGLLAGLLVGGVVAAGLLVTRRAGRRSSFSYGPSLIAGAYLAALLTSS